MPRWRTNDPRRLTQLSQNPALKKYKAKFDAFTEKQFKMLTDEKLIETLLVGSTSNVLTLITLKRGRPLLSAMSGKLTRGGRRYVIFMTFVRTVLLAMIVNEVRRRKIPGIDLDTLKDVTNELIVRRARS